MISFWAVGWFPDDPFEAKGLTFAVMCKKLDGIEVPRAVVNLNRLKATHDVHGWQALHTDPLKKEGVQKQKDSPASAGLGSIIY